MDFESLFPWIISVGGAIIIPLWLVFTPIGIVTNFLYGVGVDRSWTRPYYYYSRGMALFLATVFTVAYAFVVFELMLKVPVVDSFVAIMGGSDV